MLNSVCQNDEQSGLYLKNNPNMKLVYNRGNFKKIIGQSNEILEVFSIIEKVADSDSTIMINGETGTGKGLVAKAIHENSYRKNKPFIQINCGAIPDNLLESELFGHVKGAFTGALLDKSGKFEKANHGTVFLDEIGDMSTDLQIKLLKVLEEREFERVGGCKTIKVDIRILAATHRNLEEETKKGTFRKDLFYRLNVIPLRLPTLKERKADIPLLISHFLKRLNRRTKKNVESLLPSAMEIMTQYSWPGNVRELRNIVERLVVLKEKGTISPYDLPESIKKESSGLTSQLPKVKIAQDGICLNAAVSEFEKSLIIQSLKKTKGVKKKAAKLLQLNRTTLVEKIKRHRLNQKTA